MNALKSALKFWQEIIFIIGLGIWVGGMTMNISISFQYGVNIIFYCLFILLITCLIGQFSWKSLALALWLAVLLGLGSLWMVLAALSDLVKMSNTDKGFYGLVLGLFFFIGLTVTAISMPFKYIRSVNNIEKKSSMEEQM